MEKRRGPKKGEREGEKGALIETRQTDRQTESEDKMGT